MSYLFEKEWIMKKLENMEKASFGASVQIDAIKFYKTRIGLGP